MISHPLSVTALPSTAMEKKSNWDKFIKTFLEKYGTRREVIDDKINRWYSNNIIKKKLLIIGSE